MNLKDMRKTDPDGDLKVLKRLSKVITSRKTVIGFFLIISFGFHLIFVESVYYFRQNKKTTSHIPKKVVFKIQPPEEFKKPLQVASLNHVVKANKNEKSNKTSKKKKPINHLPPRQLEKLGKEFMPMLQEGRFPSLVFSYDNPSEFVREMYELGSKTVLYDMTNGQYYGIDLFANEILPYSKNDFNGFSNFKRIVEDLRGGLEIQRAAVRLNTSPASIEILLLVPMTVERRWIGYQVNLFRQLNIKISEIETVETSFHRQKLRILRVHLKDGSTLDVNDKVGI